MQYKRVTRYSMHARLTFLSLCLQVCVCMCANAHALLLLLLLLLLRQYRGLFSRQNNSLLYANLPAGSCLTSHAFHFIAKLFFRTTLLNKLYSRRL